MRTAARWPPRRGLQGFFIDNPDDSFYITFFYMSLFSLEFQTAKTDRLIYDKKD